MADVKAVLTETLREAHYRIVGGSSDVRVDPGEALADALLALPGVAVIQLPQPDEGPDGEGQFMFRSPVSTVSVTPGGRVWDEDFDMTASEASDHAAVLLAAAVLSEETTK